jgi:hypothetical protein
MWRYLLPAPLLGLASAACGQGPKYVPSPENLQAREWFQDAKFGLFIHWGVYFYCVGQARCSNRRGGSRLRFRQWYSRASSFRRNRRFVVRRACPGPLQFSDRLSNRASISPT